MNEEVKKEEESTKVAEEPGTSCCDHAEEDVGEEKIILGEVLDDKKNMVRIAVAGCSHGEMDKIYGALEEIVKETGKPFDLLICCGDFQAVRNYGDLDHMHVPDKFKSLQTFYKYYSREKVAPILTLFVGGNHEASGYLSELPHGGWVAPRIYYMGFSNVIRFAGLRIAGLSGIFKNFDFDKGHFERPPFQRDSLISAYHVRKFDIWRLEQLRGPDKENNKVDIMISHDWPSGITDYGNVDRLLRIKPFFRDDIASGNLGNPATMQLLYDIRPRYWLAAHLHVMFPALVPHQNTEGTPVAQPTKFLALDKPIPRRHFLQALEIEIDENAEKVLQYDAEWLAILRATDAFVNCNPEKIRVPPQNSSRKDFRPTSEELEAISQLGSLDIPTDFYQTAPPITDLNDMRIYDAPSSLYYKNPQSTKFCEWLGITDVNKVLVDKSPDSIGMPFYLTDSNNAQVADENEIRLDDDSFGDDDFVIDTKPSESLSIDQPPASSSHDAAAFLENFEAPKWKKPASDEKTLGEVVLKRRKVDIPDED